MDDRGTAAVQALPDGEAELTLVVRLPWEDVARLGQEAGRLAAQKQRPVTLDEAVSHRLRSTRPAAAHARPAGEQPPAVTSGTAPAVGAAGTSAAASAFGGSSASVSSLPPRPATDQARPPAEQARQAIERINGTA
ncbi:hypothetical protein DIZ27_19625 [Streptomyces sp. NWU339]|uniref:hypothetical protein n=1 Tax=Streptomyces sp. NWU339 TaxID=2185284 RepID=UPI000D67A366|nr:hypothetical protein [Streptomyces sp. NWU339]PWI08912.1 hypothetical protein DIZ27_19625 [Streptomyces sp. NWU339]